MNDQTSLTATAKKGTIVISRTWLDPESCRTQIKAYQDEAMSGDYDNVLVTSMKWVVCE